MCNLSRIVNPLQQPALEPFHGGCCREVAFLCHTFGLSNPFIVFFTEEPKDTAKTTPLDLVRRLTSEQTQKVAFTVYLDRTVSHLRQGQRIPFNKVLLNDGSAFNVQSGAFLCPHTGVYLFTFNINSYAKGEIDAKLVIDGKNQLDAVASAGTGAYEMSANTAVLRVTAGQAVWVANHWISDITLVNTDNFRYTSFSGVLLYSN